MLLDTHALVWSLLFPEKLSAAAREALTSAPERSVSAASLYEITLKGALGKWPEVAHLVARDLDNDLRKLGVEVIAANGKIMQQAGGLDWQHRDPFDRIIAITALSRGLPVISKDETLDTLGAEGWQRIW